jgi:hypothetical protein
MRDLPYRGLDVAAGVKHLQLLGVRYYLVYTPEAAAQADLVPDLNRIATSGPWKVYEVRDSDLVVPLDYEPAVVTGISTSGTQYRTDWLDVAVAFYQDPELWDIPLAADGPEEWARVRVTEPPPPKDFDRAFGTDVEIGPTPRRPVASATVTNIETGDDRISFDVDEPGTPVLVKASYFPNWKASGAKGPWRVTPNLMVVIPTEKHVSLHYGWTPVDVIGWLITLAGVAGVILLIRRGSVDFPEPEVITESEPGADEFDHDFAPARV